MVLGRSNSQITLDINTGKESNGRTTTVSSRLSQPQPGRLNHISKRTGLCNLSACCINGMYHLAGNMFFGGALAGAALLTVADLNDRQKDAIGGLTMALISVGTFCFWHLACCPQKQKKLIPDKSYSGLPSAPLRSDFLVPENSTELDAVI